MKLLASLLLAIGITSPAVADLTAKYAKPGTAFVMTVEIAANGDLRGDVGQPGQSFVTRGGHGFFLRATPTGTVVMRVEDIGTVMAEQMAKLDPQFRTRMRNAPVLKLAAKGELTINGRTGTAYYMQGADGTLSQAPWAVISKDPALAELGTAMVRQFEMSIAAMSGTMGPEPFADMLAVLKTGTPILFVGAELQSVDPSPIPAARFELPAQSETLDGVRKLMAPPTPKP